MSKSQKKSQINHLKKQQKKLLFGWKSLKRKIDATEENQWKLSGT